MATTFSDMLKKKLVPTANSGTFGAMGRQTQYESAGNKLGTNQFSKAVGLGPTLATTFSSQVASPAKKATTQPDNTMVKTEPVVSEVMQPTQGVEPVVARPTRGSTDGSSLGSQGINLPPNPDYGYYAPPQVKQPTQVVDTGDVISSDKFTVDSDQQALLDMGEYLNVNGWTTDEYWIMRNAGYTKDQILAFAQSGLSPYDVDNNGWTDSAVAQFRADGWTDEQIASWNEQGLWPTDVTANLENGVFSPLGSVWENGWDKTTYDQYVANGASVDDLNYYVSQGLTPEQTNTAIETMNTLSATPDTSTEISALTNEQIATVTAKNKALVDEANLAVARVADAAKRARQVSGGRGFSAAVRGDVAAIERQALADMADNIRSGAIQTMTEVASIYADAYAEANNVDLSQIEGVIALAADLDPESASAILGSVLAPMIDALKIPGVTGDTVKRTAVEMQVQMKFDSLVRAGKTATEAWSQITSTLGPNSAEIANLESQLSSASAAERAAIQRRIDLLAKEDEDFFASIVTQNPLQDWYDAIIADMAEEESNTTTDTGRESTTTTRA